MNHKGPLLWEQLCFHSASSERPFDAYFLWQVKTKEKKYGNTFLLFFFDPVYDDSVAPIRPQRPLVHCITFPRGEGMRGKMETSIWIDTVDSLGLGTSAPGKTAESHGSRPQSLAGTDWDGRPETNCSWGFFLIFFFPLAQVSLRVNDSGDLKEEWETLQPLPPHRAQRKEMLSLWLENQTCVKRLSLNLQ